MTNAAPALIASSALVSAVAEASGAVVENLSDEVLRAALRKGPLSVTILPTYEADVVNVVFTKANGYYGIEDTERAYTDATLAAADVALFLGFGTL